LHSIARFVMQFAVPRQAVVGRHMGAESPMRRITEDEAWTTAGPGEPPVLAKVENDAPQSAVALKRWPDCFILGISCDLDDRFKLYVCDQEAEAWDAYRASAALMERTGRPFARER
jgi:hypothetical protein